MSESNGRVPFKHPWPEDDIGNVGSVTVGGTPKTSVPAYWNGDVPWMASGDVNLKRITDVPTRISRLGLRFSNATMVEPPAVAIGLAGQGKTRGTVALVLCPLCTNQSVALIKGEPDTLDTTYLLYNLEFRYEELRSRSAGGGRAGLSKQLLEVVPVPLPPTIEQSKIAEILSTVDRAIEQTEALIAKQQLIKTGLMQDLLTRGIDEQGNLRSEETHQFKDSPLGRIPVEWDVKPLGQICERVTNGFVGIATPYYTDSSQGVPYLYGTNVRAGYIDLSEMRYVTKEFHRKQIKSQLYPGDMLTVQSGHIGTTVVVPSGFGEANCHALIISKFKKGAVNPEYVSLFCNYCLETGRMTELFIGSTIQHINTSEFAKFSIPLPEEEEQNRMVTLISQMEIAIQQVDAELDKLRSVKAALMQDLLTGKKRITPLLEPAAKM